MPGTPTRPPGRGRCRFGDRAVPAKFVLVATWGCAWRQHPPVLGASRQTVRRRFTDWSAARVWAKRHRVLLARLGALPPLGRYISRRPANSMRTRATTA
ncbi:transposase [Streptomyces pseudovenezuelae]